MKIEVVATLHYLFEKAQFLECLKEHGVELKDVNNGQPVYYRGYMTVARMEVWRAETGGRVEFWIMANCPHSTKYMWKYRYIVKNRFYVVDGVAGDEVYTTRSRALRAAGKFGTVYRFDWGSNGRWAPIETICAGRVR